MPAAKIYFTFLFFFVLFCFACNGDHAVKQNNDLSNHRLSQKRKFISLLRQKRKLTIVYGATAIAQAKEYEKWVEQINPEGRFGLQIKLRSNEELTNEELQNDILFLLGTPYSNPLIKEMTNTAIVHTDSSFTLKGHPHSFNSQKAIYKLAFFPNLHNDSIPLFALAGNNDHEVHHFLQAQLKDQGLRFFWQDWNIEVFEGDDQLMIGNLDEQTWTLDLTQLYDYTKKRDTLLDGQRLRFVANNPLMRPLPIRRFYDVCNQRLAKIEAFTGREVTKTYECKIYNSLEEIGLKYNNMSLAQIDPSSNSVAIYYGEHFNGFSLGEECRPFLRDALGSPQHQLLEDGLLIYFMENWNQQGYQHWALKLHLAKALPSLTTLVDQQLYGQVSPYVKSVATASFVDYLISNWGKDQFLKSYADFDLHAADLGSLEQGWFAHIENHYQQGEDQHQYSILDYYQGFNFAHEGYQIYNGYGSKLAVNSIQRLRDLGSNAIAIVPYTFMRNPNQPTPLPLMNRAGTENDESVIFAHYTAQSKGLHTLLKPQIWMRGSWPGDLEMQNEKDWNLFFQYYQDWMVHYAMMAEIYQFDMLCLGVEFAKATIARPDSWRKLIRRIRQVYSGPITYAANWGEEFEQLSFWDELDFIGLDCYYPLGEGENVSAKQLKTSFAQVLDRVKEVSSTYQKPVLFTEIGFRSVEQTWANPHAEAGGRPVDQNAQNLCYEIVFESVRNKSFVKGMFWWKWPSYLEHNHSKSKGFTPNHKLAEGTVEKYFKSSPDRR